MTRTVWSKAILREQEQAFYAIPEAQRAVAANTATQAHTDHLASSGIDGIEYHPFHGTTFAGCSPDAVVQGEPTHRFVQKMNYSWLEPLPEGETVAYDSD